MSKPATHRVTIAARHSRNVVTPGAIGASASACDERPSVRGSMAMAAASGETASAVPRKRWHAHVNRFVRLYSAIHPRTGMPRYSGQGFASRNQKPEHATRNAAAHPSASDQPKPGDSDPAAKARRCVRGLLASRLRSTRRLTSIAQVRASTMQQITGTSTSAKRDQGMDSGRAANAASNAKGSAKTEWLSLMSASARARRAGSAAGAGIVGAVDTRD